MKIRKHLKTLWDDEIKIITNHEEFMQYGNEVCRRGKNFWNDPNPTTISFDEFDNIPYDWDKEYLKIVKRKNHETVYRIKY